MRWILEARERARALWHRRREEAETDEEFRFHLEMETEANLRAGMSPEEARRRALLSFGGVAQQRERVRDARGLGWAEDLWLDVRYGTRSLRRSAGLSAVVAATLALGIGASVATFSTGRAVAADAVPLPDPDRLLSAVIQDGGPYGTLPTAEELRLWRAEAASVVDLAGFTLGWRAVGDGSRSVFAWNLRVDGRFFEVLRPRVLLGRALVPADALPGAPPAAVISARLWRELYASDPAVVGRAVSLGGEPHTVVGVLDDGMSFPAPLDAWAPLRPVAREGEEERLTVIGRLRPGATREGARAALETTLRALDAERPSDAPARRVEIQPLAGQRDGATDMALALLGFAVVILLGIGLANAAGLMTTRAVRRRREIAIRASLGSGRMRIARQLLVESALLSLAAGALGVGVAYAMVGALRRSVPEELSEQIAGWHGLAVDAEALGFALAVSLAAGLLFGLLPALHATRGDLTASLRDGALPSTADRGRNRSLRLLLAGEVALALSLLLGAGLLVRSLLALLGADPGFRTDGVVAAQWLLPRGAYEGAAATDRFQRPLLERVRALPGVRSAGIASNLPPTLRGFGASRELRLEGDPADADPRRAEWRPVTPDYLATLEVPLLRGRALLPSDDAGAPRVALASEALVRRLADDGADPLGRRVVVNDSAWTVVGVVGDVHHFGVGTGPPATLYVPQAQAPTRNGFLVARVDGDPAAAAAALRRAVWALDPDVAVDRAQPLEGVIDDFLAGQRVMTYLLAVYAAMALLITAISLYTLVAHSVARRRRELGIRLALGAGPRRILWSAMGQGMAWVGLGVAVGLGLTALAARGMAALLYGVGPLDPLVYGGVSAGVLLLALLASWIPARHAARVDPAITLRQDA